MAPSPAIEGIVRLGEKVNGSHDDDLFLACQLSWRRFGIVQAYAKDALQLGRRPSRDLMDFMCLLMVVDRFLVVAIEAIRTMKNQFEARDSRKLGMKNADAS